MFCFLSLFSNLILSPPQDFDKCYGLKFRDAKVGKKVRDDIFPWTFAGGLVFITLRWMLVV